MKSLSAMKRIAASVPEQVFENLERLADIEGRSLSNLIAYLLERSIDERFKIYGDLAGREKPLP